LFISQSCCQAGQETKRKPKKVSDLRRELYSFLVGGVTMLWCLDEVLIIANLENNEK